MARQKTSFVSRLANAGLLVRAIISEMTGRDDPNTINGSYGQRVRAKFGMYKGVSTFDVSRTSYALARAIFYANTYTDKKTGTTYGNDYLLGAPFGKPIVNIAAGFAIGSPVRIVEANSITDEEIKSGTNKSNDDQNADPSKDPILEPKKENPTIANVNQWLEENRNLLFLLARNSFRDGDDFVVMDDDGTTTELPPEDVDIITNPNNPQLIDGYDIWSSFPDPDNLNSSENVTYVDEIRRTYRRRMKVDRSGNRIEVTGTFNDYRNRADGGLEERELPVVHFANEKEGRMLYGISEYQNLYFLMANYHAVLAAAIKGNIYNSTAVPVIQGVKNMNQFLNQNFTKDADGNYILNWDSQKMLVVGDGGSVQILQADGTAADAQTLLNILFWLISQSSETPEFAFGTAVQSSKASVSEQTPMLIKKAIRKQGQLEEPIRRLIDLYIEHMSKLDSKNYVAGTQYTIDMPDILDEDLNINIQIVNALLEKGIITEETAMTMLNIGKYVKNFEDELEKARAQKTARNPIPTDVFGQPINDATTEKNKINQSTKSAKQKELDQMKANKTTSKVAEMLEKNIDSLSLEQIQEMNPNHDELGKFAEGENRGSEGTNPKDKKPAGAPYTANELVYYHGSNAIDKIDKEGFNLDNVGKGSGGQGFLGQGVYLAFTKERAADYGKVKKFALKEDLIFYEPKTFEEFSNTLNGKDTNFGDPKLITKKMKSLGYDGIIASGDNGEIVVFNPKNILTAADLRKNVKEMIDEPIILPVKSGNPFRQSGGKFGPKIVSEFNENHDAAGRFASGKSGGSKGFNDSQEADAYIDKNYGAGNFSDDELAAIHDYTGSMYGPVNRILRKQEYDYDGEHKTIALKDIKGLDSAMDHPESELKEDTILWRGANSKNTAVVSVGETFTDAGFGSTSIRESGVDTFISRRVKAGYVQYKMKINASKGTRGLFPRTAKVNNTENEFILDRSTSYKVKSLSKDPEFGYYNMEVEIL